MPRIVPLLMLAALATAALFLLPGLGWTTLAANQANLHAWVGGHPVLAAAAFTGCYVATAALSLPHAALLTVAGGWLFGASLGCALTVAGATAGAAILMVVVRSAFAGLAERSRDRIPETLRLRLARDGFLYLLALRLAPVFPFWLVNLAAAFAGMRLSVFVPGTLIGIAPVSFILSSFGAGLDQVLAAGRQPDLSILFSPGILLPLLGLATLSLLPALLHRHPGHHA